MIRLELLFLMEGFMGILMFILLHKISQMKKQVDDITKEVHAYLSFLENDVEKEIAETKLEAVQKIGKDEAENRLIQAVLQEYFP